MAEGLYSIAPGETPQAVATRRRMAEALLAEGMSTAPIRSGWQGAANLAKALMGGYDLYKADQSEASGREQANKQFMEGLGPMQGQEPNTPPMVPPQAPSAGAPAQSARVPMPPPRPFPQGGETLDTQRPPQSAVAAALMGPQAKPAILGPSAQPQQQPQPAPPAAQPMPQPQGRPPINPALIAALGNPWLPPGHSSVASHLVTNALSPEKQTFQTLPNGDILALDPSGRMQPRVVYNAPKNPTFGVVGEDEYGGKTHGWIDPAKRSIEPYNPPGTGANANRDITLPDGSKITPPAGVDLKEFRKHATMATADAMAGKKTEVQAKNEIFANKMEFAEKTLKGVDFNDQSWNGMRGPNSAAGRMLEGSDYVPGSTFVGNKLQSDKYQEYRAARDLFLSALLRDESGAAIGSAEFKREERNYFPQPGEGPARIKQKSEARRIAIEAMKKGAGPGYKPPTESPEAPAPAEGGAGGWTYNGVK